MRIIKKLYFCSILILLVLAMGCPSVNKSYPERTFYLLELSGPKQTMSTISGATLDVNRFSISPRSDGRQFIYRTTNLEFEEDFYNQFFRPPDNLIAEAVREWLDQSGLFQDVLTPISQAIGDYIIEGNIIELYGDYRNQSAAQAVIRIQFFLLKTSEDGSEPSILFGKTYNSTKSIGTAAPQNLMNGWNSALEEILDEFLSDLSYHLKQDQNSSNIQSDSN